MDGGSRMPITGEHTRGYALGLRKETERTESAFPSLTWSSTDTGPFLLLFFPSFCASHVFPLPSFLPLSPPVCPESMEELRK